MHGNQPQNLIKIQVRDYAIITRNNFSMNDCFYVHECVNVYKERETRDS